MTSENQMVLNGTAIKNVSEKSDTAKLLMKYFASRERNRTFTDLNRVRTNLLSNGHKVVYSDIVDAVKELEKQKIGSFIHGRNGAPDRFEWYYSLKSVGQSGIDGKDVTVTEKPTIQHQAAKKKIFRYVSPKKEGTSSEKKLVIALRDDFTLEFDLPGDLTKNEINIIQNSLNKFVA